MVYWVYGRKELLGGNSLFNIAIDGPAGAGKSTIAKKVAKQLDFVYVDTGAMFRSIALYFSRIGVEPTDLQGILEGCKSIDISMEYNENGQQVILNGENVTKLIRAEEVGNMASTFATNQAVRLKLLEIQRKLAKTTNVVMDGRDIGTCVLPNADIKVYLTASSKERAKRRFHELVSKGVDCNIDVIEADIIDRDNRDMTRETAPLKQADDAVLIDSSFMNIDEVVAAIIDLCNQAG